MSDVLLSELEGKAKREPLLSLFDKFVALTFKIFQGPSARIAEGMPGLRSQILKSNLRTSPEGLVSLALFSAFVTGLVTSVFAVYGVLVLNMVFFAFLPVATPIVYILITNLPKLSSAGRAAAIDTELPFVLGYMSVLAGGGVSPIETLRRISQMDVLPASKKEAKRILVDTDVFGQDPITAMENASRLSPSRYWSEFLAGYTAVLKSGGSFEAYIQLKLRDLIANRSAIVKASSDITGTIAEAYLTVTVVLGMTLYTLYMVQTMISKNVAGLQNLYVFAFLVVPLLSAGFIYITDAVQTKWPYTDYRPYRLFGIMIPFAILTMLLPLPVPLYIHTSLALGVASGAPAAFSFRLSRERRRLERALPDFIGDVTEGRKTGLSPEQSIERLSSRNYGVLSRHVKKMGAQLSWGVSLSKVISTFTSSVASWITRATGILMIEVVDVGGGTIRSFTEMASFARTINDLESQRRSALRPFVFVTYIAGVMVILTTFILVYMLSAPATLGYKTSSIDPHTIDLLLTTAVFDSFIIGLVAGKMGESSLSDGFKHGFALVIASIIAVSLARLFIPIPL
ncbi:MAG: type II secretion system F family protein [archaeon]|nr:MAG: type II secretion system F family protein [archaeon]